MVQKLAFLLVLPLALAATLIGCGGGTNPVKETTKDSAAKDAIVTKDTGKVADDLPGLKELDEADQKLARQQKVCPVSGSPLGTADMGKPYKMIVKDHVLFLCCDGCKDAVEKDPEKYLKILAALLAKNK